MSSAERTDAARSGRRTADPMDPADAVLRFLAGVGPGSEAEFYLRLFRERAPESFAAIVVDPETWRQNLEGVALDLRLLATLSLTPVVVLGFYQPERAAEYARLLGEKLTASSVASREFASDASPAEIAAAARSGALPLLHLRAADESEREGELARVLAGLATHKLILLRNEGGLRSGGRPLSVVNLSAEFGDLMAQPDFSPTPPRSDGEPTPPRSDGEPTPPRSDGEPTPPRSAGENDQQRLLAFSRRVVCELVPHELLVTVTSPLSLLHELFTVRGAGTLLRRGALIARHEGFAGVDLEALRALLESAFGRPPREDVFRRPISHVYLEERYRGAALLAQTRLGSYLSKFAVTREAQGEGLGRDLWQAMSGDHSALFWRAREHNPIRSWYEKQCDGRVRVRDWIVYWIGVAPERIPEVIAHALTQPVDF